MKIGKRRSFSVKTHFLLALFFFVIACLMMMSLITTFLMEGAVENMLFIISTGLLVFLGFYHYFKAKKKRSFSFFSEMDLTARIQIKE